MRRPRELYPDRGAVDAAWPNPTERHADRLPRPGELHLGDLPPEPALLHLPPGNELRQRRSQPHLLESEAPGAVDDHARPRRRGRRSGRDAPEAASAARPISAGAALLMGGGHRHLLGRAALRRRHSARDMGLAVVRRRRQSADADLAYGGPGRVAGLWRELVVDPAQGRGRLSLRNPLAVDTGLRRSSRCRRRRSTTRRRRSGSRHRA